MKDYLKLLCIFNSLKEAIDIRLYYLTKIGQFILLKDYQGKVFIPLTISGQRYKLF